MERRLVFLILAGLLAAPWARAEDPACEKDAALFCGEVPRGPERFTCMERNAKSLSKPCRERLERMRASGRQFKKDCAQDAAELCPGLDGKGLFDCLRGQKLLRPACAKDLETFAKHIEHERIEAACKDDAQTLCSQVRPGEHRIRDCLKKNAPALREDCRAAVEGRRKERKEPAP
jgi:hypothetical protein